ncbi:MAG: pyridoxamine 5'-phosphate oxidase family protein [Anaerolineae bacterium]|nr:pyridoxamine 5'-phosphate oxidase family protein [Anaerolineae bacterium]MCB0254228.1 pyridoxamine 5'-phosphate oxidase family protein [Anaerolineae bacterium]
MEATDPAALDIIRHAMVVRLATLSRNGRPSVTPIYFVVQEGHIWIGTVEWTLAVRTVRADPRASLLFNRERDPQARQIVRLTGTAVVRTDLPSLRIYNRKVALKYMLAPGGLWSYLTHLHKLKLLHHYHIQDDDKGDPCIIDVTPERIELLTMP